MKNKIDDADNFALGVMLLSMVASIITTLITIAISFSLK